MAWKCKVFDHEPVKVARAQQSPGLPGRVPGEGIFTIDYMECSRCHKRHVTWTYDTTVGGPIDRWVRLGKLPHEKGDE